MESDVLLYLSLTYLKLVWINSHLIKIVNIYGKLTYPGLEVDQECYVIVVTKLFRSWKSEADIEAQPESVY